MKRKAKSKSFTQTKKMERKATTEILPHEMIMEILSWLPAKSLLRFKCVNKPWCISISDPNFIKLHFHRAIETDNSSLLLIGNPEYSNSDEPITDMYSVVEEEGVSFHHLKKLQIPFEEDFMVWGSCNGVVCLGDAFDLCLLNPATKYYKMVAFDNQFILGAAANVRMAYGFSFDPYSEHLLIVVVVYTNNMDFQVEINVYPISDTSQGSSVIKTETPYAIESEENGGIYLNGALHWIGVHRRSRKRAIVYFNIMDKVFQDVPSPDSLDNTAFLSVGVSHGKLCMLSCVVEGVDMDMWVMNTYGVRESWLKLYSIAQSITHTLFCRGSLFFTRNGEVLLQNHKDCVLYDPKQKKAKDIEIPVTSDGTRPDMIVSCIASLLPLQSDTKLDT